MGGVEEEPSAPLADHLLHLGDGLRKEGHGEAEGHELGTDQGRRVTERVDVDRELGGIEGNVDDLATHGAGGPVEPVRGMAAHRLRRRHHDVAGLAESGVNHRIAGHRGAEPMIGVVAAEVALQQLDAERLKLVDVAGAGEPAIDRPDMALRRAGADLARQQRPNRGAGRRLRAPAG